MILATLPATGVFAAALDRSGQSMSAFFQPGNYFEAGISILDPTVKGQESQSQIGTDRKIDDMAGDYYFPSAALKLQLNDQFSFGILYDQPFGADAEYSGSNVFVADNVNDKAFSSVQESVIRASVQTAAIQGVATATGQSTDTIQSLYNSGGSITGLGNVTEYVDNAVNSAINSANNAVRNATGKTKVSVKTDNISMIFGFSPIKNITLYAGPVYQTIEGNVSLRGSAYSVYNGYNANFDSTEGWGWLAGAAYQIPEIALKASITYRSEIDHDTNAKETGYSALGAIGGSMATAISNIENASSNKTTITTPQSVNLDLQSGIMADTVAFANIRWVNWKDFSIRPDKFGQVSELATSATGGKGFNLVEYSDDQWTATVGLGRKLNDQWAGNVSVGYDSGAGELVSTLGPTEGYWNVGIGMQFSPTPATFIAAGVKYFWLGDAKAQTGAQAGSNQYVANFEDNNAIAYGLKLGYRF